MSDLLEKSTEINRLRDRHWVGQSFLLAGREIESNREMLRWSTYTTASTKFTRPALGKNTILNSPPAFTPLADIPLTGLLNTKPINLSNQGELNIDGMGARYSESIDDNIQVVNMRFGHIKYKGLISFFTSFYDNESAILAKYGRVSIAYYFGALATAAVFAVPLLLLSPLILAGIAWKFYMGRTSSSFMDFKPNMSLYWTRVQVIYNNIGANLGIIPRLYQNTGHWGKGKDEFNDGANDAEMRAYARAMAAKMPKFFNAETGILNVFEVALGAARLEQQHREIIKKINENSRNPIELRNNLLAYMERGGIAESRPSITFENYVKSYLTSVMGSIGDLSKEQDSFSSGMEKAMQDVANGNPNALAEFADKQTGKSSGEAPAPTPDKPTEVGPDGQAVNNGDAGTAAPTPTGLGVAPSDAGTVQRKYAKQEMNTIAMSVEETAVGGAAMAAGEAVATAGKTTWKVVTGWAKDFRQNALLEAANGAGYMSLAVNYTGQGTASFSNTLKPTSIEGFFNSASGMARDTRVSMADFQSGWGFLDAGMQIVREVFGGALDMVQMSGLLALGGNAFADFPQQWDNSTATFQTANFTMELRTPYGDDLSRYLNLYLPLATLLAGALPMSTGPKSYTSPHVCQCFSRGVCSIRLGMITELTITAGAGNLGYTKQRQPLSFDVSFSVADMSSIMHAPTGNGFNITSPLRRVFDDDNPFSDYLSVITGVHMRDMMDPHRKLAIKAGARLADYKSFISPGHIASRMMDTDAVRFLNMALGNGIAPGVR